MGRQRAPSYRIAAVMSRKQRILHVFPSFAAGGAQMRMAALANHFGARFTHTIIALDNVTGCRDRLEPALDVVFPAAPSVGQPLPQRLRTIAAAIRAHQPDLLVTSNWGAIEWAIANQLGPCIRHIHTEDGFGRDERDRQLPRRVWTRRLFLRASTTIVPSQTLLNTAATVWRLPARTLHYIPNGIDLAKFVPAGRPAGGPAVIGCVAALRPEKNLARLFQAAAIARRHHAFDLVLLGDGPDRATLETVARDLSLPVRFLGAVADPAPVYRDFTMFALSSDTEQMPLSVMEAMASGLPIAATRVGDIARMVAPDNLDFLTPRDPQELAAAMVALLADPARQALIGFANRGHAEQHFDFSVMAARWEALMIPNEPIEQRDVS
jgi:glycosyltransferase involved in cell wall biosynthesis